MNTQSGFTITELMIVTTIVAILLSIGVPSYRYVTTSSRVSSEINGLLGDMQFARSEAVREGQTVTVCPSTDGATCSGGTSGTWQSGWIVFSDANGDQNVQAATDSVLRVQRKFSGGDTFTSVPTAFTFNREGFAQGLAATVFVTLHDATSTAGYTRCLQVSMVGSLKAVNHTTVPACT